VKKTVALWLPPLAWMAVIALFSTEWFGADETRSMLVPVLTWAMPGASPSEIETAHDLIRKGAHLAEFGVLAALWFRALVHGTGTPAVVAARIAFAVSVAWAITDEVHQAFVSNRTPSAIDVGIDSLGALGSLLLARAAWHWVDRAAGLLLWTAVAGGVLAIVVNQLSGVDSGALWITAPAAAAVLALRRFARRSDRGRA
jgi:VanZ family protein